MDAMLQDRLNYANNLMEVYYKQFKKSADKVFVKRSLVNILVEYHDFDNLLAITWATNFVSKKIKERV